MLKKVPESEIEMCLRIILKIPRRIIHFPLNIFFLAELINIDFDELNQIPLSEHGFGLKIKISFRYLRHGRNLNHQKKL